MNVDDARLALDADTLRVIEEHGIQVVGVFPTADDEPSSPFHYTIGLTALGQPEVVVCGLPVKVGHWLCNEVHRRVKELGVNLAPGVVLPGMLGGDNEYDCILTAVTDENEAYGIRRFFPEYEVLQVVFPDFQHRYPWDPAYDVDPRVQKDWYIPPVTPTDCEITE